MPPEPCPRMRPAPPILSAARLTDAAPRVRQAAAVAGLRGGLAGSVAGHLLLAGLVIGSAALLRPTLPDPSVIIDLAREPAETASDTSEASQAAGAPEDAASDLAAVLPEAEPPPPVPEMAPAEPITTAAAEPVAEPVPEPVADVAPDPDPLPVPDEPPPDPEPATPQAEAVSLPLPPPPPPQPPPPRPAPARPVRPATAAAPARPGPAEAIGSSGAASDTQAPAPPRAAPRISPSWNAAVVAWLHRNKSYPHAARLRGEEGAAHVRFTVARDGRVLGVEVTRPTGSATLDDALRRLLTGATVPPFPEDMPHAEVTVQVQIQYSLRQ